MPDVHSPLVLASASPRRREILQTLGIDFVVETSGVPEEVGLAESADEYTLRLARAKAVAVAARVPADRTVLAADTVVTIDGEILEKPADDRDAARMLERLSGRDHAVVTSVVVARARQAVASCTVATHVTFRPLDARMIAAYVRSGEGRDKAGAYAVQGLASGFVSALRGSYTNVVGLPACETIDLLRSVAAIDAWPTPRP